MANANGYEVINVDEVTVHRTVNKLPQADGSVKYQNGLGKTWLLGEVVPPEEMAEDWAEALDSGEGPLYEALKEKLKPVQDEPYEDAAMRLGLPFAGYDDMEIEDILAAISVLPSATIQRIKEYEQMRDEPREEIVDYVIGYGETPQARQVTEHAQVTEDDVDADKAVRRLQTREVPEDGPVVTGEGVTGGASNGPQKAYGVEADKQDGDEEAPKKANLKGAAKKAAERRGRRDRQPKTARTQPKSNKGDKSDKGDGPPNAPAE